MGYSVEDFDPVWSDMKHPVKILATSKISFNRYIDNTKYRYNLLFGYDIPIQLPKLDHVEIIRDEARYFFKNNITYKYQQFFIGECFYFINCNKNYISAYYLK